MNEKNLVVLYPEYPEDKVNITPLARKSGDSYEIFMILKKDIRSKDFKIDLLSDLILTSTNEQIDDIFSDQE
tara:strand:+ start:502 stop:717 length:216 start_codon:yes stop_codon:yes gene_type:complete